MSTDTQTGSPSYLKIALQRSFVTRRARWALIVLTLILSMSVLVPWLSSFSYHAIDLENQHASSSWQHWLGTDDLGRDLLVRLAFGVQVSFLVGATAAVLDAIFGVGYGIGAAFFGKRTEEIMMRILDILETVPFFLIVIGFMVILEPGIIAILFALCVTSWAPTARIIRAEVARIKTQYFILNAHILGASRLRIIVHHLVPNILGSLLITMTLTIPLAIFTEAILSFLGVGLQPPMASLGTLCSSGLETFMTHPKQLFLSAGCIMLLMLSFNIIGEGLKEGFGPFSEAES